MRIAITFNLITEKVVRNKTVDAIAELDNMTTINAIKKAIEARGHKAFAINCNDDAYGKIYRMRKKMDIVFNIFEGLRGESRESQVPAILEMLQIPYTGSDPLTLALCLDKVKTKEILLYHGISTPRFQVFSSGNEKIANLKFPLICKLIHEGSSMGLSRKSVVHNEKELRRQVMFLISKYKQNVLVEEFIEGPEYSIGILGNGSKAVALPIIERFYLNPKEIALFEPDEAVLPLLKKLHKKYHLEEGVARGASRPAKIPEKLYKRIEKMALDSYNALNCNDWCRMEIRQSRKTKNLHVIELNPIAGIDPSYVLPRQARYAGMSFADLINTILDYAVERYNLEKAKK